MHAAINRAYAARHGYDFYFADVRGCARHPSWCFKLCAYSLLFEDWDEWPSKPQYEWALVLDEDAFFNELRMSLHGFLRHLDISSRQSTSLTHIRRSPNANLSHSAHELRCVVLAKDVDGYQGCNAGVVLLHATERLRSLMVKWWNSPSLTPRKNYAFTWFIDQG